MKSYLFDLVFLTAVCAEPFCGRLLQSPNEPVDLKFPYPKYDYTNHGDDWDCRGVRQSPIAIEGGMLTPVPNSPIQLTLKEAKQPMEFTMERSRAGISIECEDFKNYELTYGDQVYHLAGFHFHSSAEHTLRNFIEDGKKLRGDAEIHFVFVNDVGHPEAVLGAILIADDVVENEFLKMLQWGEPDGKPRKFTVDLKRGIFDALTHHGEYGFVYYPGSLTTPNCDEQIMWFVTAAKMSREQSAFLDCLKDIPGGGNYRRTQALTCREVQTANLNLV